MTHRHIYEVKDHQLVIDLPQEFKNKTKVLVIVDDEIDTHASKLLQLKQASTDPIFLSDIEDVNNDFDAIEKEGL